MTDFGDSESRILDFERAWQSDSPPDIENYLGSGGDEQSGHRVLVELVCLDLEYRWRRSALDKVSPKLTLTDYVDRLRELRSLDDLPLELIEEEYRVRWRWGDRPAHDVFVGRFKRRQADILRTLHRLDREMREERESSFVAPIEASAGHESGSSTRQPPDPRAPLAFNDYVLQEMLGVGRMGRVYRAWHRTLLKHVAVKYLRKSFLRNREAVNQFVREANIVSQLHHPGIVEIHGLGSTPGGGYFIAMDLVDGADLSRFVMSGEIRLTDALQWTIQACKAISHSHECGIIHCDLKPANLVLGKDGRVRVTDFGLARSTSDVTRLWDRIQGTAAYMAPEQISGWWGEITPRTDVYGLGAVLYALLTGRSPHVGSTLTDILSLVVSGVRVVSPIELRGNVPVAINDICLRCLAKSPRDRYDNVRNLIDALDGFDVTQV